MPPAFAEGLEDWSRGDGTPDSGTYEDAEDARLVHRDPDFGACLELRKSFLLQRLRYMGEVPVPRGGFVEITARLKSLSGEPPLVRIAAWAGGTRGRGIAGLVTAGTAIEISRHDEVVRLSAVIGRESRPGVDLVWDERVLYTIPAST